MCSLLTTMLTAIRGVLASPGGQRQEVGVRVAVWRAGVGVDLRHVRCRPSSVQHQPRLALQGACVSKRFRWGGVWMFRGSGVAPDPILSPSHPSWLSEWLGYRSAAVPLSLSPSCTQLPTRPVSVLTRLFFSVNSHLPPPLPQAMGNFIG